MSVTITREGFPKMICKTCGEEIPMNGCSFYESYNETTGVQSFEHEKCATDRIKSVKVVYIENSRIKEWMDYVRKHGDGNERS